MSRERTATERRSALLAGVQAEAWVAEQLAQAGWDVLQRNWRGGGGELDLIVDRAGSVRFVEVKARVDDDAMPLEDIITTSKQNKLRGAALAWLHDNPGRGTLEVCFMVAVVDLSQTPWLLTLIDDAF